MKITLILCCLASPVVGFAPLPTTFHNYYSSLFTPSVLSFVDKRRQDAAATPELRAPVPTHANQPKIQAPMLAPLVWQFLDLNQDGKVDLQDLTFLASNMVLDGDGVITVACMIFLSWVLMVSPVQAKGGGGGHGGGGGGHGGFHGSSYHHHYQYYAGDDMPDYASYRRPNRRLANQAVRQRSSSSPFDPNACSDLPIEGELVDVLVDDWRGTYQPGVVSVVEEATCTFRADMLDGGKMLRYPGSKRLTSARNWETWILPTCVVGGVAASVGIPAVVDLLEEREREWEREFDEAFLSTLSDDSLSETTEQQEEVQAQLDTTTMKQPRSGTYIGSTSESDGMTQSVKASLTFYPDGEVAGDGYDSEDGRYTVTGAWRNNKVRWIERYGTGFFKFFNEFSVTIRGEVLADGSIKCRFHSSRDVRGRFTLKKKE